MTTNRIRDYLLYLGIGTVLVLVLIWSAMQVRSEVPKSAIKWTGLTVQTAILFGYAAADHRKLWRLPRFWGIMMVLLGLHLLVFIVALRGVEMRSPLWFVLFFPIENVAIDGVLGVGVEHQRRKRR